MLRHPELKEFLTQEEVNKKYMVTKRLQEANSKGQAAVSLTYSSIFDETLRPFAENRIKSIQKLNMNGNKIQKLKSIGLAFPEVEFLALSSPELN